MPLRSFAVSLIALAFCARPSGAPPDREETTVELACDFEPDRIVVDPDVRVLMLLRKNAVHTF